MGRSGASGGGMREAGEEEAVEEVDTGCKPVPLEGEGDGKIGDGTGWAMRLVAVAEGRLIGRGPLGG
jgi:hypothetical protein